MGIFDLGTRTKLTAGVQRTLLLFILIVLFSHCGRKNHNNSPIVISIGENHITLAEFRDAYQLDAAFPGYVPGYGGLKEYGEELADQFLSLRWAERDSLFRKEPFAAQIFFRQKKAAIHALYMKAIGDKVHISEEALRQGFHRLHMVNLVSQLFTKKKEVAQGLYEQLRKGTPFDTLLIKFQDKKSGKVIGSEKKISWGELDPVLEDTIYALAVHAYSSPIFAGGGYHIFYVRDRKQRIMETEAEYAARRHYVLTILKRREEARLSQNYIKNFMDKQRVKVKSRAFRLLIAALDLGADAPRPSSPQGRVYLSDIKLNELKQRLREQQNVTFMESKFGDWTIGDLLKTIEQLPVNKRPYITSLNRFRTDIGHLIRNEFLFRQAQNEGMLHNATVDSTLKRYKRQLAYKYYLERYFLEYEVPADIKAYYSVDGGGKMPRTAKLQGILPGMKQMDDYRFYYAARKLHRDLLKDFPDQKLKIDVSLLRKEAKQINWQNPIRIFVTEQ